MALLGYGVWSLVGAAIAQRLFNAVALFLIIPWRPKFQFEYDSFRSLMHFGGYAMVAALLNKGVANVDYFVIGRWLGTDALGYYTLAFQLSVVPERRVITIIQRVVFPAFSIIQSNLKRLISGFKESLQYLYMILSPISLAGVILGPWFIKALYGNKWEASLVPLQILFVAGFFYGFEVAEMVYYSLGKPKLRVWIIGIRLGLFAIFALAFGINKGIAGIAASLTLSVAIAAIISLFLVAKLTNTSWIDYLKPVWPSFLSAVVAGGLVMILVLVLKTVLISLSPWIILIGLGLTLFTLYFILLIITNPGFIGQLRTGVQEVIRR
jgi:PST family polysaccharide transporter